LEDPGQKAARPRQIYLGTGKRDYVALEKRRYGASSRRIASRTERISSSSRYFPLGQKNPLRPSPFRRGTTCTCRWGTLWLTRLLIPTKQPSDFVAATTARARSRTLVKTGARRSSGRSSRVSTSGFGITRQWPGTSGLWS